MRFLPIAALASFASQAEVPNVFKPNEPARSAEVNQNFRYLDSAVATKGNRAPLDLAIESINQKASKSDLDNRLEVGVFSAYQKKMVADSSMLEGKIKASASSTQVKADLDAIRAEVAAKASGSDLKSTQVDLAKLTDAVAGKAATTDLAKLSGSLAGKADTIPLKTAQSDIAGLKTAVGTLASASDLAKTKADLGDLTNSVKAKADTGDLAAAKSKLATLDGEAVKHVTMEFGDPSFNRPPVGTSLATIISADGAPFGAIGATWYNLISLRHRNGVGDGDSYGGQIAWGMTGFQGRLAFRSHNGTWSPWAEVVTKASLTAATLPGGPYVKESPSLSVDTAGVVHMAALKVHSDLRTPDYVFEPGYQLSPLAEVESYTRENRHLPDVPSAAEIEKGGLDLAKMNLALLRKVEELTLHAIAQEKRIDALESEIRSLR